MKEIKLRAWDSKNNKMVYKTIERVAPDGDTQIFYPWGFEFKNNFGCHAGFLTFMQYTGLKDKNGKEIYEGDIVKNEWITNRFENRTVKWNNEISIDENSFRCAVGYDAWVQDKYENEIIGNIHENPELLNK